MPTDACASVGECPLSWEAILAAVRGATDIDDARAQFRESAVKFWAALREADSDLANSQTAHGDLIVETWAGAGRAGELLEPLLRDDSEEVRYAAAAHLLRLGQTDKAVSILESLSANPHGLVAPTARLLLRTSLRDDG